MPELKYDKTTLIEARKKILDDLCTGYGVVSSGDPVEQADYIRRVRSDESQDKRSLIPRRSQQHTKNLLFLLEVYKNYIGLHLKYYSPFVYQVSISQEYTYDSVYELFYIPVTPWIIRSLEREVAMLLAIDRVLFPPEDYEEC